MEKEIKKIIEWIKTHYKELPESDIDGKKLVIFATGDFSGEYGYGSSDLESWGVDEQGRLFWAYASGCSCHCFAGVEEKTIKLFEAEIPKEIENTDLMKMVGLFVTSKEEFRKAIQPHSYNSF